MLSLLSVFDAPRIHFAYTEYMFSVMSALNIKIVLLLYGVVVSAPLLSSFAVFFAEWLPFLLIAFIIAYKLFSYEGERVLWSLFLLFLSPLAAVTLAEVGKFIISAPRPFADGLGIIPLISVSDPFGSFPSAHAAFFGALGTAIFFEQRRVGKWYLLSALLIGISRIAVGVHFPSDIIAGLFLGVLLSIIANIFQRKHYKGLTFAKV